MLSQDDTIKLKFDNSYNGRLFAVQGDTGRTYNLQILSDMNNILDVSGMKLRLYIGNDKEVSYTDGEITSPEEGKFKVQVYNSQLKYPGLQKAQFVLTDKDGQKIGSKVFDLYVEEGLETGQTLGKNIFVDFETIDETLKLIRNYDKTLEEAKEVDLKLKVDIQEGTETRQALVDCKKKALEIKGQLDTSKTSAGKTLQDLKTTKTESETLKTNLSSENTKASEKIKTLGKKTEAGNSTIAGLGQSTNTAKATKESLDTSNTTALSTKKSLEEATSTANSTKISLETLKGQGDTLSRNLSSKITSGDSLKTELDRSIGTASTSKSNLDASIDKAARTDATLKSTDTEAKGTEQLLRDLLGEIGVAKEEVQQIIASGDLSKYVTDPKLQEALIDYAKLKNGEVPAENLPTMGNGQAGIVPAKNGKFLSFFADELTDMPSGGIYGIDKVPFMGGRVRLIPIQQLPEGGTTGQILKKTEDGAEWANNLDLRGYVKKDGNKVLSTNDYTDEDKAQVASIPELSIRKTIHLTLHDAIDITLNRLGYMCEISIIATNQEISNIAGLITNNIVINHEEIGKFFTVDVPIPLTGIIKKTGQSEYQNGGEKYGEIFMPMIISSNSNSMEIITNIDWEKYIANYQLRNIDIIIHGMFFCK